MTNTTRKVTADFLKGGDVVTVPATGETVDVFDTTPINRIDWMVKYYDSNDAIKSFTVRAGHTVALHN